MDRIRRRVAHELPQITAYFQAGGLVDAVLNLGLPAPIDVQISGSDLRKTHELATVFARELRSVPGVSDILIPQDIDYPALHVDIDRDRSAKLGLTSKEVVSNVITALTSNAMIAPSYWVDERTGNDYLLTVQYPENKVKSLDDLMAVPLRAPSRAQPTRLDAVSSIVHTQAPTEVDHYQLNRVIDVYVAPSSEDLSRVKAAIDHLLATTATPDGVRVTVRGMVQGMHDSFVSFGFGLILSVILVYLILVAQFKSFIDPVLILLAVPTGLTGVLIILWATDTTLNVMSLMGVVMMVGIVVSNSILIVEFAHHLRIEGTAAAEAIGMACRVRLRPVLMTSLATLIGLIPMAAKLGTGAEAYAPLAKAIVGGLAVSVVLTMYIVPAAYLIVYRTRARSSAAPVEAATMVGEQP
jgi:multidrug efflux pump subunit AcrB